MNCFSMFIRWNAFIIGYVLGFFLYFWISGSLGLLLFCILLSLMGSIIHSSLKKRDPLTAAKTTFMKNLET